MATKTYVVKASDVAASKTTSTYVPKTTRASSVKSTTTTAAPAVSSSSSSSSSPVSATASSYSPEQMSFGGYQDSPAPISPYASAVAKTGGATGQEATTAGLKDAAIGDSATEDAQDWTRSFSGMATEAFESQVAELLMKPLDADDIEIKPDGLLYLPEIKYRRILNKAFGPGGWGLAPRSEHSITPTTISREYALICRGRFVSTARGEQDYFNPNGLATASEGCKSNALMRCCKDLGIASELWDPSFIRKFKKQYCEEVFYMNSSTNKKKKLWKRKDAPDYEYPWVRSK
ncbi:mitochondrial genome maintenance MGM101 [Dissophora ornata]|nr:mitochondrial genome maintenance MGM101 [Dissophora ornata]